MCDAVKIIPPVFNLSVLWPLLIDYKICKFSNHSEHEVNETDDAVNDYFSLIRSQTFADPFQTSCIRSYHNNKVQLKM